MGAGQSTRRKGGTCRKAIADKKGKGGKGGILKLVINLLFSPGVSSKERVKEVADKIIRKE